MSATAKRQAMRSGGEPPPADEDDGITAAEMAEFDRDDGHEPEDDDGEEEDDETSGIESMPLPASTVEDEKGDWIYTLQYPARSSVPFSKVRIPKHIYAKDVRRSTRGRNDGETMFYMLCSMSKIPAKDMDLLDARDYSVLQSLMHRRALGNSRAVLRSIAGGG